MRKTCLLLHDVKEETGFRAYIFSITMLEIIAENIVNIYTTNFSGKYLCTALSC
jgi:hypothetical protein